MNTTTTRDTAAQVAPSSPASDAANGTEDAKRTAQVLPAALNDESTEGDFEKLFRIAEDKTAQAGRLRRPTSGIPAVEHADK